MLLNIFTQINNYSLNLSQIEQFIRIASRYLISFSYNIHCPTFVCFKIVRSLNNLKIYSEPLFKITLNLLINYDINVNPA